MQRTKHWALVGPFSPPRPSAVHVHSLANPNTTNERVILTESAEGNTTVVYAAPARSVASHIESKAFESVFSQCRWLNPDIFWDCKGGGFHRNRSTAAIEGGGDGDGDGDGALDDASSSAKAEAAAKATQEAKEYIRTHPPRCSDHAFVARIDRAYVMDNTLHEDVPGTVFTSSRAYKFQPYVRAEALPPGHPSLWRYDDDDNGYGGFWMGLRRKRNRNRGKNVNVSLMKNYTLHTNYTCLGSVLQAYPTKRGHFPHELLPRLLFLAEHLPSECPILMAVRENGEEEGGTTSVATQFLDLLPLEIRERIVPWRGTGHIYGADAVYVANEGPYCAEYNPHNGGMSTFFHRDAVALVRKYYVTSPPETLKLERRQELLQRAPTASREGEENADKNIDLLPRRRDRRRHIVVIKRHEGSDRFYAQHDDLMSALRGATTTTAFPSDETTTSSIVEEFTAAGNLSEHIHIFATATHVIGPHGAGFANLVFCAPRTKVVEIGWDGSGVMEMDSMYYTLSNALDLDYRLVIGRGSYVSTISVDVSAVMEAVLN